jgi:hypothetical protein
MIHWHCTECHHEWDGAHQQCTWCHSPGYILSSTDDRKFSDALQRVLDAFRRERRQSDGEAT